MHKGGVGMTKYKAIPEFSQFVEYVTQGDLVDDEYQVVINHVDLSQQDIVPAAETLKSGYEHVDTLGRLPTIEGQELDGVKSKLAETYHEDIVTEATKTTNPISITGTVVEVKGFPEWRAGLSVKVGDVFMIPEDKNLWKVVQAHTTQSDWLPSLTPALWVKYYTPEMGYQEWVQPTGAHDAYNIGDKVLFNGHLWESKINANVWSPTVYPAGWTDLGVYP
jgi:hypothetical protein